MVLLSSERPSSELRDGSNAVTGLKTLHSSLPSKSDQMINAKPLVLWQQVNPPSQLPDPTVLFDNHVEV